MRWYSTHSQTNLLHVSFPLLFEAVVLNGQQCASVASSISCPAHVRRMPLQVAAWEYGDFWETLASPEWQQLHCAAVQPHMRSVARAEAAAAKDALKRQQHAQDLLYVRHRQRSAGDGAGAPGSRSPSPSPSPVSSLCDGAGGCGPWPAPSATALALRERLTAEVARDVCQCALALELQALRAWEAILQELTGERGVWVPDPSAGVRCLLPKVQHQGLRLQVCTRHATPGGDTPAARARQILRDPEPPAPARGAPRGGSEARCPHCGRSSDGPPDADRSGGRNRCLSPIPSPSPHPCASPYRCPAVQRTPDPSPARDPLPDPSSSSSDRNGTSTPVRHRSVSRHGAGISLLNNGSPSDPRPFRGSDPPRAPAAAPGPGTPRDAAPSDPPEPGATARPSPGAAAAEGDRAEGVLEVQCWLLSPMQQQDGVLYLTDAALYWYPVEAAGPCDESCWRFEDLTEMWPRRYLLQRTALEFFFRDGAQRLVRFTSAAQCQEVFRAVHALNPPAMSARPSFWPERHFAKADVTEVCRARHADGPPFCLRHGLCKP